MLTQNLFNKLLKKTLKGVFFVIGLTLSQFSFSLPASCPQFSPLELAKFRSAIVDWVVDGDTIHTRDGEKLRLLHIDAPELNLSKSRVAKKIPAEPFAKVAKNDLAKLIGPSNKIYWVNDEKQKDKYGRELALVFNQQGLFINAQLVIDGYAQSLVLPPNQKYWQCIAESQQLAYLNKIGIWSHDYYQAKRVSQLKSNHGSQLITGKITQVKNTKKYRWLIIDENLWVGIKRKDFHYFDERQLNYKIGDEITLRGYPYHSHGKLRMKLQHPAMVLQK